MECQTETQPLNYPTFCYTPLESSHGSIRLLKLVRHLSPIGALQCEISNGTIQSTYTCLSYVWGSEEDQQEIVLNGKSFWVRKNLYDFLCRARLNATDTDNDICYWIDAICINQNDDDERAVQVGQMGTIYRGALEVVVWMGEDKRLSPAFEFARNFDENSYNALMMVSFDLEKIVQNMSNFISNPYWMRAWITQEIYLAQELKFKTGGEEIRAEELGQLLKVFASFDLPKMYAGVSNGKLHHPFRAYAVMLVSQRTSLGKSWCGSEMPYFSLNTVLWEYRGRQCLHPRDRIYSLLPLVIEGPKPEVNYRCRDEEVFLHVMKLSTSNNLCFVAILAESLSLDASRMRAEQKLEATLPIFKLDYNTRVESSARIGIVHSSPCGSKCNCHRWTSCRAIHSDWKYVISLTRRDVVGWGTWIFLISIHDSVDRDGNTGTMKIIVDSGQESPEIAVKSVEILGADRLIVYVDIKSLLKIAQSLFYDETGAWQPGMHDILNRSKFDWINVSVHQDSDSSDAHSG